MNKRTYTGLSILVALLAACLIEPIFAAQEAFSSPSLSGVTIVLDPGHGGPDGGAVGEGVEEKEVSLQLAQHVREYLEGAGASVWLTRESDKDLASPEEKMLSRRKTEDIKNRVRFIEDKGADLFVSLHMNAIGSSRWRGAQVFFNPKDERSEKMAVAVQGELREQLGNTNREALGLPHVYLLNHPEAPGILVEAGFLSNDEERKLLTQNVYQKRMAAAIYVGLLRYLEENEEEI